jgi:glycosyltransferase involved in cell wall biosynthesis
MTQKLRVLTLIKSLAIGELGGGADRTGLEIAVRLDRSGFDPVVCAFWRRGQPVEETWVSYLAERDVPVFFVADRRQHFDPLAYIGALSKIPSLLGGRLPVDVIHSHYQLGSVAAPYLRRRLGARAIVRTAHGPVDEEWGKSVTGGALRALFSRVCYPLTFDAEAGVSQQIVASLDRRLIARALHKKAALMHAAIGVLRPDEMPDSARARAELGLAPGVTVVGSVGRLSEQKGYKYLLEAIPAVLAVRPDLLFVLIGDGELRASLEKQAVQLGITDHVLFAGSRPNARMYYPAFDLFVLPSLWEGLSAVVLESMASRVAVVGTDIPGVHDLVQDGLTGWLAPARDPQSLAAAILDAIAHPEKREEFARRAASEVVPHYTLERIAERYEALYRKVVATRGER